VRDTAELGAVLRGDPASVRILETWSIEDLRDAARRHGVLPLVADELSRRTPALADLFRPDIEGAVAADLYRETELRRVVAALADAGVASVLFKGAALAYTHYARPDLRARDDSDVLIAPEARRPAHRVLVGLGYGPDEHVTGELVTYQAIYAKRHDGVRVHTIDLHWRIANPQLFADVLSFEELRRDAVGIPALGPAAFGPSGPHALFLACVHRVAHHRDTELLAWIYDIHLIASRLTDADWETFIDLAVARGMAAICRQGLERSAALFGTAVPDSAGPAGRLAPRNNRPEPSTAFLNGGRPQLATFVSDLRTLSSWRDRGRLIREHLAPPPSYMRQVYAPASRAPLGMLYVWRAVRGAWRWLAGVEAPKRV
jgi:hypothetical protein